MHTEFCMCVYVSVCMCFFLLGRESMAYANFLMGILKKMFRSIILKDHFLSLPISLPRFLFFLIAYHSFVSKSLFLGAQIMIITNGNLG